VGREEEGVGGGGGGVFWESAWGTFFQGAGGGEREFFFSREEGMGGGLVLGRAFFLTKTPKKQGRGQGGGRAEVIVGRGGGEGLGGFCWEEGVFFFFVGRRRGCIFLLGKLAEEERGLVGFGAAGAASGIWWSLRWGLGGGRDEARSAEVFLGEGGKREALGYFLEGEGCEGRGEEEGRAAFWVWGGVEGSTPGEAGTLGV